MSLIREAVERLLYGYGVIVPTRDGVLLPVKLEQIADAKQRYAQLLDDLIALWPAPSRETLKKLLQREFWQSPSGEESETVFARYPELTDKLIAWAEGQKQKVWCEHLVWEDMSDEQHGRDSGWYAKSNKVCFYSAKDFKFCPICATPRPAEG